MNQEQLEKFAYRHGMRPDLLRDVMYYSGIGYRQKDIVKEADPSKDTVSKYMRILRGLPEKKAQQVLKSVVEKRVTDFELERWKRLKQKERTSTNPYEYYWRHKDLHGTLANTMHEIVVIESSEGYVALFRTDSVAAGGSSREIASGSELEIVREKAEGWMKENSDGGR